VDVALPHITAGRRVDVGMRQLGNWLLCWVILPNAGYAALWLVGGPPRAWPILITGVIGILINRAPFAVRCAVWLAALLISALDFISALFNLHVSQLLVSSRFLSEMNVSASIEYIVAGAGVMVTAVAGWRLLRRPAGLVDFRKFVIAALAVVLAILADATVTGWHGTSYNRTADPGAAFQSGAAASDLRRSATGSRHVVLIMVEAMGQPVDLAMRRRLLDIWARPDVRAAYTVESGETPFYGSTTNGEMRELCGRWGDYSEVMRKRDARCLPAMFAAKGYRTQAWHSFSGAYFDRAEWYPRIGFQSMTFGPDLIKRGAGRCPGVFAGACDRDVPRQMAAALKAASEPTFLYWLTVNTHLPIPADARLRTERCDRFDAALYDAAPMTCRLLQSFDQTGGALAREITAADFPDADILIVGDHLPPFLERSNRNLFKPDRVPWIMLRAKARG